MEERTRLCARFRPGAHTSPVELLNGPCNRCEGWCACTGNTSVTRTGIGVSFELTMVIVGASSGSADVQQIPVFV